MKLKYIANVLDKTRLRSFMTACFPARGILSLNYHRIGDSRLSNLDRGLWSASVESFEEQIAWLKLNAEVISPADIDAARQDRRGVHVLVTFDDGYRDNYDLAFPVLRRLGVPATFFVTSGYIDKPHLPWWDEIAYRVRTSRQTSIALPRWYQAPLATQAAQTEQTIRRLLTTYKSLPLALAKEFLEDLRALGPREYGLGRELWVTWDMVRAMTAAGMTIGGHTVNHLILSGATAAEQWSEISTCAARIQQETGRPMEYFAYPVGARSSFNEDTKSCLKRIGVRYAFSYYGGFAGADSVVDPYDMPRMAIEPYVDRSWFRAMIQLPQLFCRVRDKDKAIRQTVNEIGA